MKVISDPELHAAIDDMVERLERAQSMAARLLGEVLKVRQIHKPVWMGGTDHRCDECGCYWPCLTAKAVYLTGDDE